MERYYKPVKGLQKYIRFYLDIDIDEGRFLNNTDVNYPTIFPAVNLVYSEKTNDYSVGENSYRGLRFFMGGVTRLSSKFLTHDRSSLITVFFTPYGFQHIFNISIAPMANCFTPMEVIDPVGAEALLERELNETNSAKRVEMLEGYFLDHLSRSDYNRPVVDHTIEIIQAKEGNIKVSEIADIVGVSERTLRRSFKKEIGVSVKEYINIARINFASVLLTLNPDMPVKKLFLNLVFYDQSHFLKHLRKYVGVSAGDFKELSKTFLGHYSKIQKEDHF